MDEWERQPGESSRAFAAFVRYRDMGPERSLMRLGIAMHRDRRLIERWSSGWDWNRRAQAWDYEVDRQRREAALHAIREMSERHIRIAMAMQQRLAARLASMNPDELPLWVIPQWFQTAATLERLARGLATMRHEVGGPRGGAVPVRVEPMKLTMDTDAIGAVLDLLTEWGIMPPPPAPDD